MPDDALSIAIEARAEARAAQHRLDRMNGSLDRLADAVTKVDGKLTAVLLVKAKEEGESTARSTFMLSRRYVITTVLVVLTSTIPTTLITVFLRHT